MSDSKGFFQHPSIETDQQSGSSNPQQSRFENPPPYSPSSQHHHHQQPPIPSSPVSSHDEVVPSFNPACVSNATPTSLYPAIPHQLPPQPVNYKPPVTFPVPQPYNHPIQPHYGYPQQPTGYGSTMPTPPAGFHVIHIPHHHQHSLDERRFPFGAILFVFGWFFPPLWILGACCCASSRNPYEAWWARLNLIMALLLLISSLVYSMLAMLAGDWWVGLQWVALRQEI